MSRIRLSFVTNSSSSSFILAVKDEGFLNSGTSKLEKFVKGIVFGDAEVIKTKEELDGWFAGAYMWWNYSNISMDEALKDRPETQKLYKDYLQYITNGFLIVRRTVDNNEDTMIGLINQMPDGDNIIMIEEEY